ncbi:uncharacterized protein LOC134850987 isoform X2 [Symsagittifera roscoffensis]|uniref:uncharacterized protein LOC134850987 isoform X2 n=1 Tax=Symsagittifera roscoffensis TaxID=84072 RepID=UPI00307C67E9
MNKSQSHQAFNNYRHAYESTVRGSNSYQAVTVQYPPSRLVLIDPQPPVLPRICCANHSTCVAHLEHNWRECMTAGLTLMFFTCVTMCLAALILLAFPRYGSLPLAIACIFSSTLQLSVGFFSSMFSHKRPTSASECFNYLCFVSSVLGGFLSLAMIIIISVALSQNASEYDYVESGPIERHIYAKENCGGDCEAYWLMLVFLCCGYFTSLALLVFLANMVNKIKHLQRHIAMVK